MLPLKKIVLFALLTDFSACAYQASPSAPPRPAYADVLSRNVELTAMPAYAEVTQGGKGRQYDYESLVEPILQDELIERLRNKGYRAVAFRKVDLRKDGAYVDADRLHALYREKLAESKKAQAASSPETSSDISLREASATLKEKIGKEFFVFADYEEYVQSNAERVVSFALGMLADDSEPVSFAEGTLTIGLIEADTGNVLWTSTVSDDEDVSGVISHNRLPLEEAAKAKIAPIVEKALASFADKESL